MGNVQNFLYVVAAANLENKLDASLARVKRDALTHVNDFDYVGTIAGTHVQYAGKRAGAVG
jgi:membrane-bound lytic murein transglycosylase MltF